MDFSRIWLVLEEAKKPSVMKKKTQKPLKYTDRVQWYQKIEKSSF